MDCTNPKLTFQDCLDYLELNEGQSRGLVSVVPSTDPDEFPGWMISFGTEGIEVLEVAVDNEGNLSCWTEVTEMGDVDVRVILEFMKTNAEPKPLELGSVFDSLPIYEPPFVKKKSKEIEVEFFQVHPNHLEIEAAGGWVTWNVFKNFAMGREFYGGDHLSLEGDHFVISWYGLDESHIFPFSFERVVKWLIDNQIPIRH